MLLINVFIVQHSMIVTHEILSSFINKNVSLWHVYCMQLGQAASYVSYVIQLYIHSFTNRLQTPSTLTCHSAESLCNRSMPLDSKSRFAAKILTFKYVYSYTHMYSDVIMLHVINKKDQQCGRIMQCSISIWDCHI